MSTSSLVSSPLHTIRVSDHSSHSRISARADPKGIHDSGSQAAIAVSVLILLAILALGVIYFKRRNRRKNSTFSGHLQPVNADPESAADRHFAGRTHAPAGMSRDKHIHMSTDTAVDSSPDPFFSALGVPAKGKRNTGRWASFNI
jgi:hypothetical protein